MTNTINFIAAAQQLIDTCSGVMIVVSGEGEKGTEECFLGRKTTRAIAARLRRERCGGDRWATAYAVDMQGVWVDLETGQQK